MADIDIKCPECDAITSISEFVELKTITCSGCQKEIVVPEKEVEVKTIDKLRLKKKEIPEEGSEEAEVDPYFKPPKPMKPKKDFTIGQHIIAWVIFLGLSALMFYMRYQDFLLDDTQREMMATYAPMVVIAFHILMVLKAFSDNVMHGVLALLVPGYSIIYLMFICDDFYARAVFAGLMVGMGEDAWASISAYFAGIYDTITGWLSWE
ncbi:MAG: hypothetical protein KAI74_06965 [Kiritimatiellae bacterium]|nr:hypothetical protein [Kiritimatiellia bacterium]